VADAIKNKPKNKTLETQQHSQNQEKIDKLQLENVELKKKLDQEQLLHTMLYKEWKELNEHVLAKEHEVHGSNPKNLFYKYAFYLLLISSIPAYYFLNTGKEIKKISSSKNAAVPTLITPIKDSAPVTNSPATSKKVISNQNMVQQPALEQPVVKSEEKRKIPADTSKAKMVTINKPLVIDKPLVEGPLTDSIRDEIYWQGWNAYYDRTRNHFKKSSERYKVWLEGWNDGKSDAKKLLAKDSLQKLK
jgi:hypothetical protein